MKKRYIFLIILGIFAFLIIANNTEKTTDHKEQPNPTQETSEQKIDTEFSEEQLITIIGYDDDAMEPHISRDGQTLFFNNKESATERDIYYATKIDENTFEFQGEVMGINTKATEGTASLSNNNNLYYVSTKDYESGTIYSSEFDSGKATNEKRISGTINIENPGWLNMDVWVSPDENYMYTSFANFRSGTPPEEGDIRYAIREGDEFNIPQNEQEILKNINTDYALEYAPELSDDGLEIFYSQAILSGSITARIYYAKRNRIEEPFEEPILIMETEVKDQNSFFEAPTISSDSKTIYFHKMKEGTFFIYKKTRN